MAIPILLVASVPDWIGPARLPKYLSAAGFSVTLLAPPNALAAKTRFLDRVAFFPERLNIYDWVYCLVGAVRSIQPRIIVPCDDLTTRLLQSVVLSAPPDLRADVQVSLAALIVESLGDPAYFEASLDKSKLPVIAEKFGVRVIPWATVATPADAPLFASVHGYPVVLKAATGGASGETVAICQDATQLAVAYARLQQHREQDSPQQAATLIVQAYIPGKIIGRPSVAWEGGEIAGITREFVVKHPPETGPGSVIRFYCEPEARSFSQALTRGLGLRGMFAVQYIVHERSGELYLLEICRRVTPGHHSGAQVGVDLCVALHAALSGSPSPVPVDLPTGFERTVAQFPQEWLRDPESPNLRNLPIDAPWDDPELLAAMLALGHPA